ncbi:flagellar hook assembly protein FlgD [Salsuginibacillus kocurii]|uniref:flagellar hook assembly protein FlgD n=1 Tax=Salsuginibacillus kocurii TaxID=427078 RepID=UPI000380A604|nr:flagellar hook assembly protein FlgD [Salsuginibacillus kocurii]
MSNTVHETYSIPQERKAEIKDPEDTVMGKDDFLQILIAQLQNQDPLDPMDDKDFVAQMAQFTSLEQMTNMSDAIQDFVDAHEGGALVQHSELIGNKIQWEREVEVDEYRTETELVENEVVSVKRDSDGNIRLLLDDDNWISSEQLAQVAAPGEEMDEMPEDDESD